MDENQLLHERYKKLGRTFVKYRKVMLTRPLQVLEMDIKVVWVEEFHHNAYILTVIDTFTRFALGYRVGYSIGKHIVKELWEEIIEKYLQPYDCLRQQLDIEIRNYQLSGNMSLREVPCPHPKSLDGIEDENLEKEMSGAKHFHNHHRCNNRRWLFLVDAKFFNFFNFVKTFYTIVRIIGA